MLVNTLLDFYLIKNPVATGLVDEQGTGVVGRVLRLHRGCLIPNRVCIECGLRLSSWFQPTCHCTQVHSLHSLCAFMKMPLIELRWELGRRPGAEAWSAQEIQVPGLICLPGRPGPLWQYGTHWPGTNSLRQWTCFTRQSKRLMLMLDWPDFYSSKLFFWLFFSISVVRLP